MRSRETKRADAKTRARMLEIARDLWRRAQDLPAVAERDKGRRRITFEYRHAHGTLRLSCARDRVSMQRMAEKFAHPPARLFDYAPALRALPRPSMRRPPNADARLRQLEMEMGEGT